MSATWSHALTSSMRPPSTACSASMECGGVRTSAMEPRSRRAFADSATRLLEKEPPPRRLFLGDDGHRQLDVHVRMQMQRDDVVADRAQRTARQAHFTALNLEVLAIERFGDVRRTDGAEQLALGARLRAHGELEVLERSLALGGRLQVLASRLFQLR